MKDIKHPGALAFVTGIAFGVAMLYGEVKVDQANDAALKNPKLRAQIAPQYAQACSIYKDEQQCIAYSVDREINADYMVPSLAVTLAGGVPAGTAFMAAALLGFKRIPDQRSGRKIDTPAAAGPAPP